MTTSRPLKPWLSIDDQVQRLIDRGMTVADRAQAASALEAIGYYRLSGYWYPYRESDPDQPGRRLDTFVAGAEFTEVLRLYSFDRALKGLVMRGIEHVEVAFRSRIGYLIGERGPLAHCDPQHFRSTFDHARWWEVARGRIGRARDRDETISHHDEHYGGQIPIWVLTDLLDFSDLSKLYAGMVASDQRELAEWFNVTMSPTASKTVRKAWGKRPPLVNWLEHLAIVRNICAHHGRLWNRRLTPLGIPLRIHHLPVFAEIVETLDPVHPDTHQIERVFGTICVIAYLLDTVDPGNTWRAEVDALVAASFPAGAHRNSSEMGYPTTVDAEFEATQPIGNAINALLQAEQAVAAAVPMPPEVAERMDAVINRLTSEPDGD